MEDREKCEELQNNENRNRVEDHEDPEKTHYFWIQSTEAEEDTDKRKTLTELITNQTLNKKETSPEADAHGQSPQQATTQREESKDVSSQEQRKCATCSHQSPVPDERVKCSVCCKYCCIYFAKLCCPPGVCCITTIVSNRMAFIPPKPTYEALPLFETKEEKGKSDKWKKRHKSILVDYDLLLKPEAQWPFDDILLHCVKIHFVETKRKKLVMCMFVRCVENSRYTILFSHGNGSDLGQMTAAMLQLGLFLQCNVFAYDYTGYGESRGKASAKNVMADADAACSALTTHWKVKEENIILCGQSLGTAPTINLAAKKKVAGVIIISGFMSILSVVCAHRMKGCFAPGHRCVGCCDILVSISKCQQIASPVLVIHGKEDRMINMRHGQKIYEACPNTVTPTWIDGAGHNDVPLFPIFWLRLKRFIEIDLQRESPSDGSLRIISKTSSEAETGPTTKPTKIKRNTPNQNVIV